MENIYFRNICIPEKEYVEEYEEGNTTVLHLDKKEVDGGFISCVECRVLTTQKNIDEIDIQYKAWKEQQEKESLAMLKESKLDEIEAYDKSSAVNSFSLNGQSMWLDYATRNRVYDGNERLKLMGRTDTTLWLNGMCIELPIEQAQSLIASIEVYAKDCYNITERHKAEVMALKTYDEVMAFDITADYPEKIELNISETNIISL
nr:MAG TPA: protein of unknown function (DUF4376) [Caudoviricetes sp.]